MAQLKTQATKDSVKAFLDNITDDGRRKDCKTIAKLMSEATNAKPEMWGSSIIGFGRRNYKYESGREAEWMVIGFSPRKTDLTLYLMLGVDGFENVLKRLGKHKMGKGCLYIKKLSDVNLPVLEELITKAADRLQNDGKDGRASRK